MISEAYQTLSKSPYVYMLAFDTKKDTPYLEPSETIPEQGREPEAVLKVFATRHEADRYAEVVQMFEHNIIVKCVSLAVLWKDFKRLDALSSHAYRTPVRVDLCGMMEDMWPHVIDVLWAPNDPRQ